MEDTSDLVSHFQVWYKSNFSAATPLILPLGLYPNLEELGDYMGLALNSEEVQKNLALLPVAANVRVCTCHLLSSTVI